jgi:DNA-binding MarR family transcriptional regulator
VSESIGIDDVFVPRDGAHMDDDPRAAATAFDELFHAAYLCFHRRDGKRNQLAGASRAVLTHLSCSGPLTIGETALHLDRAQSVVSEIVDGLEAKGLLARERDPRDRRRALVWLTDAGFETLRRDREVVSRDLIENAMAGIDPAQRSALLDGLRALTSAALLTPAATPGSASSPEPEPEPARPSPSPSEGHDHD